MKLKIKSRNGISGKWIVREIIDIGSDLTCGRHIIHTPARHALELEIKLNGGITMQQAESMNARAGNHSAPIYRVDVHRDSDGARIS